MVRPIPLRRAVSWRDVTSAAHIPEVQHGARCAGCNLCTGAGLKAKSVVINAHGYGNRLAERAVAK